MKKSKAVHVTKHKIRNDLNLVYNFYGTEREDRTRQGETTRNNFSSQYDSKRDNTICTCKNVVLRKHQEIRYFSGMPKQIYAYHGPRGAVDIGVGSVKAFHRKQVKRIYLPETEETGVGSSDLSTFIYRRKFPKVIPIGSYYDHKKTSSKCVGGILDYNTGCVVDQKLSPITHTKSGTTSPKLSLIMKINTEIGSNTINNKTETKETQFETLAVITREETEKQEDKPRKTNVQNKQSRPIITVNKPAKKRSGQVQKNKEPEENTENIKKKDKKPELDKKFKEPDKTYTKETKKTCSEEPEKFYRKESDRIYPKDQNKTHTKEPDIFTKEPDKLAKESNKISSKEPEKFYTRDSDKSYTKDQNKNYSKEPDKFSNESDKICTKEPEKFYTRDSDKSYTKDHNKNYSKEPVKFYAKESNVKELNKKCSTEMKTYSSDSLVQHVHNLENPSSEKQSRMSVVDPMENKLEREYRKMFTTTKSKESKTEYGKPIPEYKSASILRRRFDALRRGMAKKENPGSKKKDSSVMIESSNSPVPTHKDVSITSDPPSLISRSYSNPKPFSPITQDPQKDKYKGSSYKKEQPNSSWPQNPTDSDRVKGMFKLWGKKFNFEDEPYDKKQATPMPSYDTAKKSEKEVEPKGDSIKKEKESKKFFFFKRKSKEKPKAEMIQKKEVTAGRCEISDGLVLKLRPTTSRKINSRISEEGSEISRKTWLRKFLSETIESARSVNIRWNNSMYATSSSTVFELIDSMYKNTSAATKSATDITSTESSYYETYTKQVNFVQDIEAWMIPRTIPDNPVRQIPIKQKQMKQVPIRQVPVIINSDHDINKMNIYVINLDKKRYIEKSEAFSHNIGVILQSNKTPTVEDNKKVSSEYLRIDIPGDFFDTSSDESKRNHSSDEEVFKIVEYETNSEIGRSRKAIIDMHKGDHASTDIKVIVTVKDSKSFESKILETVIKRSPNKDVVIQDSHENVSKRCDVIGVGIITQRSLRERQKPILRIRDELSDEESEPKQAINQKKCEFAESYLQEYYRHWTPGLDMYPWCASDTHVGSGSEESLSITNPDASKSCPNMLEDFQAVTMVTPCEATPCCHNPYKYFNYKEISKQRDVICSKMKSKFKKPAKERTKPEAVSKPNNAKDTRVLPKDSLEVFRKRKLYAASAKSEWVKKCSGEDKIISIPSIPSSRGCADNIPPLKECPDTKKQTPNSNKSKYGKRVSIHDSKQEGILAFKGACERAVNEKNDHNAKHAVLNPDLTCVIPEPGDLPCDACVLPKPLPYPPCKSPQKIPPSTSPIPKPINKCSHPCKSPPKSSPPCGSLPQKASPSCGSPPPVKKSSLPCVSPPKSPPPCESAPPRSPPVCKSPPQKASPTCGSPPPVKKSSPPGMSPSKSQPLCESTPPRSPPVCKSSPQKASPTCGSPPPVKKSSPPCVSPPKSQPLCESTPPRSPPVSESPPQIASPTCGSPPPVKKSSSPCKSPPKLPPSCECPPPKSPPPFKSSPPKSPQTCGSPTPVKKSSPPCKSPPKLSPPGTPRPKSPPACGTPRAFRKSSPPCKPPPKSPLPCKCSLPKRVNLPQSGKTTPPCQCIPSKLSSPPPFKTQSPYKCKSPVTPPSRSSCQKCNSRTKSDNPPPNNICPNMFWKIAKKLATGGQLSNSNSQPSSCKAESKSCETLPPPSCCSKCSQVIVLKDKSCTTPRKVSSATGCRLSPPPIKTPPTKIQKSSSCEKSKRPPGYIDKQTNSIPSPKLSSSPPKSHECMTPDKKPSPPPCQFCSKNSPTCSSCSLNTSNTSSTSVCATPPQLSPTNSQTATPCKSIRSTTPPPCPAKSGIALRQRPMTPPPKLCPTPKAKPIPKPVKKKLCSQPPCNMLEKKPPPPPTPPREKATTPNKIKSCDKNCKMTTSSDFEPSPSPTPDNVSLSSALSCCANEPRSEPGDLSKQNIDNPPKLPCLSAPPISSGPSYPKPASPRSAPFCLPQPCGAGKIKSKMSGVHLKKKGTRKTCENECSAWKELEKMRNMGTNADNVCSLEKITIKIKDPSPSTTEIREPVNVRVADEDGRTIYERKDYTCGNRTDSALGNVYKSSKIHRVLTPLTVTNMVGHEVKTGVSPCKSNASTANLVEINLKLRIMQGDKTTEIDIGNGVDGNKQDGSNKTPEIFNIYNAKPGVEIIEDLPNNDINIKITVRNFKPKHKMATVKHGDDPCTQNTICTDDFSKNISDKFRTVSTGYSDVEDDNVYSIHRATINLASSGEISNTFFKLNNDEITKQYTDCEPNVIRPHNAIQIPTNVQEYNYIEATCSKKSSAINDLEVITSDLPDFNDTDEKDSALIAEIIRTECNESKILKQTSRQEKKKLLKKVFKKASNKTKNKENVRELRQMLKIILTDSSEYETNISSNGLAEDLKYTSLKSNYFRNTDSMNNYYNIDSTYSSLRASKIKAIYPSEEPVTPTSKSSESDANVITHNGCMCTKVAEKLKKANSKETAGCCCRIKLRKDEETDCDLRDTTDYFLLNYKAAECVDVETQNSKFLSSKVNSFNVSVQRTSVSNTSKNIKVVEEIVMIENPRESARSSSTSKRISETVSKQKKILGQNTIEAIEDIHVVEELRTIKSPSISHNVSNTISRRRSSVRHSPRKTKIEDITIVEEIKITKSPKASKNVSKDISKRKSRSTDKEYEIHNLDQDTEFIGIFDRDQMNLLARKLNELSAQREKDGEDSMQDTDPKEANDILQSFAAKKAVLEIYAEKTENGDNFVANLPKFVKETDNELVKHYEELASNSYNNGVCRENVFMVSIRR